MDCKNAARGDNFFEFIADYSGLIEYVKEGFQTDCVTPINSRFAVAYVPKNSKEQFRSDRYQYNSIPRCFGLMDEAVMEDTGVAQVRRANLDLYGNGILVGIADTGIDYQHPAFLYADGSTKIYSIWDQTIDSDRENSFGYGTEYEREEIEEALKLPNPLEKVPSTDTSGHGTFLSGMISGNEDPGAGFSGIAPNSELIVVKLRQAKAYLKEYYCMEPESEAYAETDLMLAIRYITQIAWAAYWP